MFPAVRCSLISEKAEDLGNWREAYQHFLRTLFNLQTHFLTTLPIRRFLFIDLLLFNLICSFAPFACFLFIYSFSVCTLLLLFFWTHVSFSLFLFCLPNCFLLFSCMLCQQKVFIMLFRMLTLALATLMSTLLTPLFTPLLLLPLPLLF